MKITKTGVVVFIAFFIFLWCLDKYFLSNNCGLKSEFLEQAYSDLVIKKYIDAENHRHETVLLKGNKKLIFSHDTTFYAFVELNDSVSKNIGDNFLYVHRNGKLHKFIIDFACEK